MDTLKLNMGQLNVINNLDDEKKNEIKRLLTILDSPIYDLLHIARKFKYLSWDTTDISYIVENFAKEIRELQLNIENSLKSSVKKEM